jgi:haloalkane dehalogenase
VLLAGFDFEGRRVPLASQQGIFIWGADDPTFPEPRAREMVPQFPNVAGFHSIAKAKLFVYEEHPQEVARLIDRFLAAPLR